MGDTPNDDHFPQIDDEELQLAAELYLKKFQRVVDTREKLSFRDFLLITAAMLYALDNQLRTGEVKPEQYKEQATKVINQFKENELDRKSRTEKPGTPTADSLLEHIGDKEQRFFSEFFRLAYATREYMETHAILSDGLARLEEFQDTVDLSLN